MKVLSSTFSARPIRSTPFLTPWAYSDSLARLHAHCDTSLPKTVHESPVPWLNHLSHNTHAHSAWAVATLQGEGEEQRRTSIESDHRLPSSVARLTATRSCAPHTHTTAVAGWPALCKRPRIICSPARHNSQKRTWRWGHEESRHRSRRTRHRCYSPAACSSQRRLLVGCRVGTRSVRRFQPDLRRLWRCARRQRDRCGAAAR